jgi:hypothetical protein
LSLRSIKGGKSSQVQRFCLLSKPVSRAGICKNLGIGCLIVQAYLGVKCLKIMGDDLSRLSFLDSSAQGLLKGSFMAVLVVKFTLASELCDAGLIICSKALAGVQHPSKLFQILPVVGDIFTIRAILTARDIFIIQTIFIIQAILGASLTLLIHIVLLG